MKRGAIVKSGEKQFSVISYSEWLPIRSSKNSIKSKIVTIAGERVIVVDTGHVLVEQYSS
jgi:hypothetical protein